jgi:hypothetical protein
MPQHEGARGPENFNAFSIFLSGISLPVTGYLTDSFFQATREFQCILYLPPYWEPFCQSLPGYLMDSSSQTRGHIMCQSGGKEKERKGEEKRKGEGKVGQCHLNNTLESSG